MNDHINSAEFTQPSYFAIIPAHIRYCKELEMGARFLYGEITALSNKEGYCWASNQYFSDLYDVDISTIKRWLNSLRDKKFIIIETNKNGISWDRKIWISSESQKMFTKAQKCTLEGSKMSPRTNPSPYIYNNTKNNTVSEPVARLTAFFIEKLKEINPKIREPNIPKWEKEMQKIIDRDKRTLEELKAVIEFIVEQHKNPTREFTWAHAVQSPKKLADHFSTIWLEMTKPASKGDFQEKQYELDKQFAEKIRKSCADRNDIDGGPGYILFIAGHASVELKFGCKDFRKQCIHQLQKRGINIA